MTRGNEQTSTVFYKGKSEDFIVFVEGETILNQWRKDRTVPLAQVVSGWKIFITHAYVAIVDYCRGKKADHHPSAI